MNGDDGERYAPGCLPRKYPTLKACSPMADSDLKALSADDILT